MINKPEWDKWGLYIADAVEDVAEATRCHDLVAGWLENNEHAAEEWRELKATYGTGNYFEILQVADLGQHG